MLPPDWGGPRDGGCVVIALPDREKVTEMQSGGNQHENSAAGCVDVSGIGGEVTVEGRLKLMEGIA
jgi:hypothetical protein